MVGEDSGTRQSVPHEPTESMDKPPPPRIWSPAQAAGWLFSIIVSVAVIYIVVSTWIPGGAMHDTRIGREVADANTYLSHPNSVLYPKQEQVAPYEARVFGSTDNVGASGPLLGGPEPVEINIRDLMATPGAYLGKAVGLQGQVHEVLGPREFTVSRGWLGPRILVINVTANPNVPPVHPGNVVGVQGFVRTLDPEHFLADFRVQLEPTVLAAYKDQPVIAAVNLTGYGT